MIRLIALMIVGGVLSATVVAEQAPALRVVVIEGEDAVNIIQQKTAVRPVVEVRDRNNLPVPGALVTFSIGGQAATFGGASTLTVATNAAGQAVVTGLTPSAAGAFQIQVSAAFQGQVATATIAQTNVLTAAQAAAAGASGASGASGAGGGGAGGGASGAGAGGAAGGGGIGATTIAVAGAAVAGAAVATQQIVSKAADAGDLKFTGSFSGIITGTVTSRIAGTCTYRRAVTATARMLFKEHSDTAVTGQFDYTGSDSIQSSTCVPTPPSEPQFLGQVDLTGAPSRFSGRTVFAAPAGSPVSGSNTYSFEGSISGDSATGTFTYEQKTSGAGNQNDLIESLATGTFTITFQKAQ